MGKVVVSLQNKDIQELNEIIMDRDGKHALKFMKDKILSQVQRQQKSKLDVEGETHLQMCSPPQSISDVLYSPIMRRICH